MLSIALAIWGSSSTWIEAYFLGRIEKTMIHQTLLLSQKVSFVCSDLKDVSTNVQSNFLLFMSDESWQYHRKHF